jgi:phenylacetic acid degradation operon negative regulatory protein
MLASGELEVENGTYKLSGRLLERMARQDVSRRPPLRKWGGTWRMAVVTAERRTAPQRSDLRSSMHELRFAELREGVWLRPDNLAEADLPRARATADEQCLWLQASVDDPVALAVRLWDLDGWALRARALVARMRASRGELEKPTPRDLREGFVLAAAALRHMQADPLMPDELLPEGWPGGLLRREYDDYGREFGKRFREALDYAPGPW